MAGRMQSPSSINTFRQCPRKYYYRYIKKLPDKPGIALVRGRVVHSVLEDFYDGFPEHSEQWRTQLHYHALGLLEKHWTGASEEFAELEETPEELEAYKEESARMVINWVNHFCDQLAEKIEEGYEEAFKMLTPEREIEYMDHDLNVRGFIDAIEKGDKVVLMDYKTSKRNVITDDYRLQLGIYALLYLRRHQQLPEEVGIHFLRHDRQTMQVNDQLLLDAQFEIEQVHSLTQTKDIRDYPKKEGPLCNWCGYYNECFGQKTLI